jgi:hypothetical protein
MEVSCRLLLCRNHAIDVYTHNGVDLIADLSIMSVALSGAKCLADAA